MNKYIKRLLSLLMAIVMIFPLAIPAEALVDDASSDLGPYVLQVDAQTTITAYVPDEYRNSISQEELLDIAIDEGLQDGDSVQIYYVEIADAPSMAWTPPVIVPPILHYYPTTTTKKGTEYKAESYFLTSAAKGESFTFSKEYTKEVSSTFSVTPYEVTAELKGNHTATVSVTFVFNGPEESSPYNSREFNMRIFRQAYDYTQQHYAGPTLLGTKTGVVYKPTKSAVYSVDSYQS